MIIVQLSIHEAANLLLADEYAGWSRAGALALAEFIDDFNCEWPGRAEDSILFNETDIRCEYSEYIDIEEYRAVSGIQIDDWSESDFLCVEFEGMNGEKSAILRNE